MTSKTIYKSIDHYITHDVKNYTPSVLYIKRIRRDSGCFIYYFGKTKRVDEVYKYSGSGVIWEDYIKKYGKENIETVWVSDVYFDHIEIQSIAISFSIENNIVESESWANRKLENGIDGGLLSIETRKKISAKMSGIKHSPGTSGTIWINNGVKRSCIKHGSPIPLGWVEGYKICGTEYKNISVAGKNIYNNGAINKYFSLEDLPIGWTRGKLKI